MAIDLIRAHRNALRASARIVDQTSISDLDSPTPCVGWALRDLLAHMIGQNYGFAAATEGHGHDLAAFADHLVGASPAAQYAASVERVVAAFATPSVLDEDMYVAVIRGGTTLPGSVVIGFHLVDYVVHGWDVAKSIAVAADFDDEVLGAAEPVAEAVPDQARSFDARAPFRPSVATSSAAVLDRIVANLGRAPDWSPATA